MLKGNLSNIELQQIAKKRGIPLDIVLSKDELLLPSNVNKFRNSKRWNIIINLQDIFNSKMQIQPGTHWVCLMRDNYKMYYFDSYGFKMPEEVIELARKLQIPTIHYSEKQIQKISTDLCGWYCLYFIKYMNFSKYDYTAFNSLFPEMNQSRSDEILTRSMR